MANLINEFATSKAKAKKEYRKFLKTNNIRHKDKANKLFAKADAIMAQIQKPDYSTRNNIIDLSKNKNKQIHLFNNNNVKVKTKQR